MPAQDQVKDLARRIAPHLQECSVQALAMCAIVTDAEGNASRVSLSGAPIGADPQFLPQLLAIDRLGDCWSRGEI